MVVFFRMLTASPPDATIDTSTVACLCDRKLCQENRPMNRSGIITLMVCCTLTTAVARAEEATQILSDTGIQGGLVVHLGCGDGQLTAALRASDAYLVYGLDTHPANVAKGRRRRGAQQVVPCRSGRF